MAIELQGPPKQGPRVRVAGDGIDLAIVVNDENDLLIVALALRIAERRRYAKLDQLNGAEE